MATTRTPIEMSPLVRTALRWLPLGLAGTLVAVGGLAVLDASAGQESDREQVAALVAQREQEATEAEDAFHDAWVAALAAASPHIERQQADSEAMQIVLTDLAEESPTTTTLIAEHDLDAASAEALVTSFEVVSGPLDSFDAVVRERDDSRVSYMAVFEVTGNAGLVEYTTTPDGSIRDVALTWDDGSPLNS